MIILSKMHCKTNTCDSPVQNALQNQYFYSSPSSWWQSAKVVKNRFLTLMNFLLLTLGQTLKFVPKFELLKSKMMQRNLIASGLSWIATSWAFVSSLVLTEKTLTIKSLLRASLRRSRLAVYMTNKELSMINCPVSCLG